MQLIGARLIELVESRKFRVEAIADAAGCTAETIYKKLRSLREDELPKFSAAELLAIYSLGDYSVDTDFNLTAQQGNIGHDVREMIGSEFRAMSENVALILEYIAAEKAIDDATITRAVLRQKATEHLLDNPRQSMQSDLQQPKAHGIITRGKPKQTSSKKDAPQTRGGGKK